MIVADPQLGATVRRPSRTFMYTARKLLRIANPLSNEKTSATKSDLLYLLSM